MNKSAVTPELPASFELGGHTFRLVIDYAVACRLRKEERIDLINFHNGSAIQAFSQSPDLLYIAIALLCKKQREQAGLNEEEFAALFDGDAFERAYDALEEAIVNFTPPAKRPVILAICKRSKEIQAKQAQLTAEKIASEKATKALDAKLQEEMAKVDEALDNLTPAPPDNEN